MIKKDYQKKARQKYQEEKEKNDNMVVNDAKR